VTAIPVVKLPSVQHHISHSRLLCAPLLLRLLRVPIASDKKPARAALGVGTRAWVTKIENHMKRNPRAVLCSSAQAAVTMLDHKRVDDDGTSFARLRELYMPSLQKDRKYSQDHSQVTFLDNRVYPAIRSAHSRDIYEGSR
jgi:hypothetical protein